MSRDIEAGDEVVLEFPPGVYEQTRYLIRAIQRNPNHNIIYLRGDQNKSETLVLSGRGAEFSGHISPIKITYVDKERSKPEIFSEQEYLERITRDILSPSYRDAELEEDIDSAAEEGYFRILRFLAERFPEEFKNSSVANSAATSGQVEVLRWLDSLDPPIEWDGYSIRDVIDRGYVNVLKYVSGDNDKEDYIQGFEIPLVSVEGDTFNLEMFEWAYQVDPDYVRELGPQLANDAAKYGHLDAIIYFEALNPPIRANQEGIEAARKNNHLDIVRYLESGTIIKSARKQ